MLSPLHPVIDWAVDKVLVGLDRNTAPVMAADVAAPMVLVQGMYSNGGPAAGRGVVGGRSCHSFNGTDVRRA